MREAEEGVGPSLLREIGEKLKRRRRKKRKTRLRCYRIATIIDFYIILRSVFFVHHPVRFFFKDLDTIYAPLGVLFVALCIFISFFYHQ